MESGTKDQKQEWIKSDTRVIERNNWWVVHGKQRVNLCFCLLCAIILLFFLISHRCVYSCDATDVSLPAVNCLLIQLNDKKLRRNTLNAVYIHIQPFTRIAINQHCHRWIDKSMAKICFSSISYRLYGEQRESALEGTITFIQYNRRNLWMRKSQQQNYDRGRNV